MRNEACAACRQMLPGHAAGELAAADQRGVAQHLAACASCRREAADYDRAHRALGARQPLVAPRAVHIAVSQGLLARRSAAAGRVRVVRMASAAACTALVIAGAAALRWVGAPQQVATSPARVRAPQAAVLPQPAGTRTTPSPHRSTAAADAPIAPYRAPEPAVQPAAADPVPQTRTAMRPPAVRKVARGPVSFLDIPDASGRTARQILQARATAAAVPAPGTAPGTPDALASPPAADDRTAVVSAPTPSVRLRAGGQSVVMQGERAWDAHGRLTAIRVRVDADPAAGPNRPAPTITPASVPR